MKKILDRKQYAENKFYEVEVYYTKGGMNYYSGGENPRGYYLSITPVEITPPNDRGFSSRKFMMFSGLKKFLQPATRFSQKVLDNIQVDNTLVEDIIRAVAQKENLPLPA